MRAPEWEVGSLSTAERMNMNQHHPMRTRRRLAAVVPLAAAAILVISACAPPPQSGPKVVSRGHYDAPAFELDDDELELLIEDEDRGKEYDADEIIFRVRNVGKIQVPADPNFAFLGAAGSDLWVLPQDEDEELIYLGIGTEEVPEGVMEDDEVTLTLLDVDGPGDFFFYIVDSFGVPTVVFDSTSALPQSFVLPVDAHIHGNWAFTAKGDYTITWQGSGELEGGGDVTSDPTEFSYRVG